LAIWSPVATGEGDARVGDAAPLLLDLLALVALQAGQEVGEVGIRRRRAVGPVELDGGAQGPARRARRRLIVLVEEEQVRRREPGRSRQLLDRAQQEQPVLRRARQQARPRHRRERDRVEQLRVVVEAVAPVRIGPGPVEDVLAVGVVLEVERTRGDDLAGTLEGEEVRRPAGVGDGARRFVQRAQVGHRHEGRRRGLGGDERVPGRGVDLGGVVEDPDDMRRVGRLGVLARFALFVVVGHPHPLGSSVDVRSKSTAVQLHFDAIADAAPRALP
jgi:hypothetical protein